MLLIQRLISRNDKNNNNNNETIKKIQLSRMHLFILRFARSYLNLLHDNMIQFYHCFKIGQSTLGVHLLQCILRYCLLPKIKTSPISYLPNSLRIYMRTENFAPLLIRIEEIWKLLASFQLSTTTCSSTIICRKKPDKFPSWVANLYFLNGYQKLLSQNFTKKNRTKNISDLHMWTPVSNTIYFFTNNN